MALIICLWSNRYFKMINIQQYSFRFVPAFTNLIYDLLNPYRSPHTFTVIDTFVQ